MKKFLSLIMIMAVVVTSQAQIKISALPAITGTNVDSLLIPVVQSGVTKKAPGYLFKSAGGGDGISLSQLNDSLAKYVSDAFQVDDSLLYVVRGGLPYLFATIHSGSGGGATTLQNAFDASVLVGDDPVINGNGNNLGIDNVDEFSVKANSHTLLGLAGKNVGGSVNVDGSNGANLTYSNANPTVYGSSVDVSDSSATITGKSSVGGNDNIHILTVSSQEIQMGRSTDTDTVTVQIVNPPILGTLPTDILAFGEDGKTIVKYPYPSGVGGTATLAGGTVTITTDKILTGYKIFVSVDTPGGTQGFLSAPSSSVINNTSFTINSSNPLDTSTVYWWIAP